MEEETTPSATVIAFDTPAAEDVPGAEMPPKAEKERCIECNAEVMPGMMDAHKRAAHSIRAKSTPKPPPRERTRPNGSAQVTPKAVRAQKWEKQIVEDLNPLLVKLTATFCNIPAPWLEMPTPPEATRAGVTGLVGMVEVPTPNGLMPVPVFAPSLKEQLALSRKQAHRIASAFSEFADTPMGMAIAAWVNANQAWISLGAACVAVGGYGWHIMQVRAQVTAILEQLQAAQQAAQGTDMPAPGEAFVGV